MTQRRVFALISLTPLVTGSDLFYLCEPLRANARHAAAAWGYTPPDVVIRKSMSELPDFCSPILITEGGGRPGALAEHWFDQYRRGPAAEVHAGLASGLREGSISICECLAHEIVEAGADEEVNIWVPHPDPRRVGVEVVQEIADPVQTTYEVKAHGAIWPVANFVTPAWFDAKYNDPEHANDPIQYDFSGELQYPGQIGPEGYVVLRKRNPETGLWERWYEDVGGKFESRAKAASTGRSKLAHERAT